MKLNTLKLKNFRGYKEAVINLSDDLNLIIGRNDVGKSTIMDTLEIFFNGDGKSPLVKAEIGTVMYFQKKNILKLHVYLKLKMAMTLLLILHIRHL